MIWFFLGGYVAGVIGTLLIGKWFSENGGESDDERSEGNQRHMD